MGSRRGGAPGSEGAEEARSACLLAAGEPRTPSVKIGLAWAGTKKRAPKPGARARAPALRSLLEPAREARGSCRRESLEWRARDVSAPCLLLHLTPFPAHRVRLGTASIIRAGPALRRGLSQLRRTHGTRAAERDPAAAASEPTPPPPGRRRSSRTRFLLGWLQPARGQNTRAPGGRAGALQLQQAARGARRPFAGAAAAAAATLHWGTEGAARD